MCINFDPDKNSAPKPVLKKVAHPLDIPEQIENLRRLNLIIDDENEAREFLSRVSYYRLKGVFIGLKPNGAEFDGKTTFKTLTDLYAFDSKLRHLVFNQTEGIEIALRSRLANYYCLKYKDEPLFYQKEEYFNQKPYNPSGDPNVKKFSEILVDHIGDDIFKNKDSLILKKFTTSYFETPFYAVAEILSFGTVSMLYENMLSEDKKEFTKKYYPELSYKYMGGWLRSIVYVRNVCAHHGRLFNLSIQKRPKLYSEDKKNGNIDEYKIFSIIFLMKYFRQDKDQWKEFVAEIGQLLDEYKDTVNLKIMGFPENWEEVLLSEPSKGSHERN